MIAAPAARPEAVVIQVGDTSVIDGRVRLTGLVVRGCVKGSEQLEAIGLERRPCTIDEVLVDGVSRVAVAGDSCLLFVSNLPDSVVGASSPFWAVASSTEVFDATAIRVSMARASYRDEPLPAAGPASPLMVLPVREDLSVRLRFSDHVLGATLKAPAKVLPPGPVEERLVVLDRPVFLAPGLRFTLAADGELIGTGTVVGPR